MSENRRVTARFSDIVRAVDKATEKPMLAVCELYGPVKQGEGKTAGKEVMFLRLSGCNLACDWCDSAMTWNWIGTKFVHPDKYDKEKEVHKKSIQEVKEELYLKAGAVRGLVISGGEPMLQQRQLIKLLRELSVDKWWVEVETNGTIPPMEDFLFLIDQFNCSPKTANSGPDNPLKKRFKPEALRQIANSGKATFKFVIQNDTDAKEIQEIIKAGGIKPEQIWLMPEGRTREEQLKRQEEVKHLAAFMGYNFSPRLQVLEFDDKRAV